MSNPQQSFSHTQFQPGSFWWRRRNVTRKETLYHQLDMLKQTGRYDAFKLKWHPAYEKVLGDAWPVPSHLFWDSDIAKWMEGACYFLQDVQDTALDAAVDDMVGMVRSAQQEDGYLNLHYQVVEPGKRFTNLRDMHELYNLGHLIEAAIIHNTHYKNDQLLEPIMKYVRLIHTTFGRNSQQIPGYPGHPEIELALTRLHHLTGDPIPLDLAKYFVTERGNLSGWEDRHYYDVEAERRGEALMERPNHFKVARFYSYLQAHAPTLEQPSVEGHSVRAMYLLTAVADLVRIDNQMRDAGYHEALLRLWDNMVEEKMYLTGGIGTVRQWEGFAESFILPQSTDEGGCYAETCAAIGVMMLAERLLQLDLDRRFADIMELCLYNAVLTSASCDGKAFTYVNQLGSSDTHLSERHTWFECACCPPNFLRTMGCLGGYLWTFSESGGKAEVNVHLYTAATLSFEAGDQTVTLKQESDWPWSGHIRFSASGREQVELTVRLRIPSWATGFELDPPLSASSGIPALSEGYLVLPSSYLATNPTFALKINGFAPRLLTPHPYTNQNTVAIARGPLIYCVEDFDNPWVTDHFKTTTFDTDAALKESSEHDDVTGEDYVMITAVGAGDVLQLRNPMAELNGKSMPSVNGSAEEKRDLKFVPYYFRANRPGRGQMRVGIRKA